MKINKLLLILCIFIFLGCGSYRYCFDTKTSSIVSCKGNGIVGLTITDTSTGKRLYLTAKDTAMPRVSLMDYKKHYEAGSDEDFVFKPNTTYYIYISPSGDRVRELIELSIDSFGSIIKVVNKRSCRCK